MCNDKAMDRYTDNGTVVKDINGIMVYETQPEKTANLPCGGAGT